MIVMLQKLQWDSLQKRTGSEMVSSPYPLQLTLNQFPPAPEGSRRDMCRFSAIQAYRVRPFSVSVSFEHRTTSCFYHLHCTVFTGGYFSDVLMHGFLDTRLLIHSWCDIARIRVGAIIGR